LVSKFEFDIAGFRDKVNALCENNVDFIDAVFSVASHLNIDNETLMSILKKDHELRARLSLSADKLNYFKK
jgi:hypothetical protein